MCWGTEHTVLRLRRAMPLFIETTSCLQHCWLRFYCHKLTGNVALKSHSWMKTWVWDLICYHLQWTHLYLSHIWRSRCPGRAFFLTISECLFFLSFIYSTKIHGPVIHCIPGTVVSLLRIAGEHQREDQFSRTVNMVTALNGWWGSPIICNLTTAQGRRLRRDYNHCHLMSDGAVTQDQESSKCWNSDSTPNLLNPETHSINRTASPDLRLFQGMRLKHVIR